MDTEQKPFNNSELIPSPQSLVEVLHDVEVIDESFANRSCCWQDVIDAIESATAEDDAKAERSSLRARLRKSGPELAVLESLAGMIPDQDGLCVLRGGLTTLCRMVSLRLETRAKILRAFEGIPETFMDAVQAGMRFPGAADLLHAVRQLYSTLVENVAILIGILLRSHPHKNRGKFHAARSKVFSDLTVMPDLVVRLWKQRPGKEAEVVENCLAQVSRAAERVDRCSRAATERTVGEIHIAQHSILASNVVINSDVKAVKSGVDGIQAAIVDGITRLESRLSGADREKDLQTATEKMLEAVELLKALRDGDSGWHQQPYLSLYGPPQLALPWLPMADGTVPRLLESVPLNHTDASYEPASPPATAQVSFEELLKALDVPEGAAAEAFGGVTRRSYHLKSDTGTRSNRLMEMKRFTEWLEAPPWASDLILVDGHCGNVAMDKVTPMSAICASLVGTMMNAESSGDQDRPVPIIIHHFCGQHLGRNPLSGPGGLIRSLIHQLLVQIHDVEAHSTVPVPSLNFIDDQLLAGIAFNDISSLCRLFCELFVRIDRSRPVFCIIDGVSEIETALYGWQEDALAIVGALLDLVEDFRTGPALRVLLTSPQRSTKLAESVVSLDRHVSLLAAHTLGRRSYASLFERDIITGRGGVD
ncbi:hypothetical protein B0I37DRAFT_393675 [Chaetomium sp. MPI-CAGE-AT-0009]|nr:hypothetical protein B0I37DRAFT_393675 [Chaetomium sp. MPI-CAGE-AT-0009]